MNNPPLLELKDISFKRKDFSLKISASIEKSQFISLLGPSGCGKTTVLRLICGLEQQSSGNILLNGERIDNITSEKRNIGLVFQDYALFPHLNVYENIAYGPKNLHWPQSRIKKTVHKLMEIARLSGYEKRKVTELSGGERQRVALVRALAPEPTILLLDEPLSALDAGLRMSLRNQIKEIQQQTGVTMIYVTHDQQEAMALSDRILLMNNGRVIQRGKPEELYQSPTDLFSAQFLGETNLIPDGNNAYTFFRPESILNNPSSKTNTELNGVVNSKEYRGEYYRYTLKLDDGTIIKGNHTEDIILGSKKTIYLSPEKIRTIH